VFSWWCLGGGGGGVAWGWCYGGGGGVVVAVFTSSDLLFFRRVGCFRLARSGFVLSSNGGRSCCAHLLDLPYLLFSFEFVFWGC